MNQRATIFGAGKIAGGFLAHLLTLSGYRITFVEKSPELVAMLRTRGQYRIHVMGAPEKDAVISGFEALCTAETDAVARAVAEAGVVFVSVGGPNLPRVAESLAPALAGRTTPLNIIICENYFQPARWLRELLGGGLENVGIVETLVLRSCVEPSEEMRREDPFSLRVQDMWTLPADRAAFVGEIPAIQGLDPQANFAGNLVRKLFTYNAINAVIAYSGYCKGYRVLSDAANDPELVALARQAAEESSEALCREYGFDPEEQRAFAASAIAKYQKREIVDPIERNARDPLRKLGRHDRLVGPAELALAHGIEPSALAHGIAAALRYDEPGDPAACELQSLVRAAGPAGALAKVAGIDAEGPLARLVEQSYPKKGRDASF